MILPRCEGVYAGENSCRQLTSEDRETVEEEADRYASEGFRVIALAQGDSLDELALIGECF